MNDMKSVHINGVGGKGMAPLAALALQLGWTVTGDDLKANHRTEALSAAGIDIELGRNTSGPPTAEYLATNLNAEKFATKEKKPQTISRLALVNRLFDSMAKKQICVTGSFGKSTATGILFQALQELQPSVYMGACLPGTLCGAALSTGDHAIVEACEYKNAYFELDPWAILHLNTYSNHEDFFGQGVDGFERSLRTLINKKAGRLKHLVSLGASSSLRLAAEENDVFIHTVGFGLGVRWKIEPVVENSKEAIIIRDVERPRGDAIGPFPLSANSRLFSEVLAGVAVMAHLSGLPSPKINRSLDQILLPERRCEVIYEDNRFVIIDDNARHPAQVRMLIETLNTRFPGRKLILAEPWGRKNPRNLSEWADALRNSDMVVLMPVGECSSEFGGAELPNAHTILGSMITSIGGSATAVNDASDAPLAISEWLTKGGRDKAVLTAVGYDSAATHLKDVLMKVIETPPALRAEK